jgi:hypothetical protein
MGLEKENADLSKVFIFVVVNNPMVDPVGSRSPLPPIQHRMEIIIFTTFLFLDMILHDLTLFIFDPIHFLGSGGSVVVIYGV